MRKLVVPALAAIAFAAAAGCDSSSEQVSTTSEDAYVVLQARTQEGAPLTEEDLDDVVSILRERSKAVGAEAIVQPEENGRIVVQFPGRPVTGEHLPALTGSGVVELYDLEKSLAGPSVSPRDVPVEHASLYRLLAPVQPLVTPGTSDAYYVFSGTRQLVAGPFLTQEEAADELRVEEGRQLLAVPRGMVVVTCGMSAVVCPGANGVGVLPDRTYYYLFKYDPPKVPQMTGEDLKLSGTRADFDPSPVGSGRPIVTMEFTKTGAKKFQRLTRDEWVRGRLRNMPQHFAIVLDRELKTFPQIDYTDSSISGGIGGGRAQIEGLESAAEAKAIAATLQTGALPFRLATVESHL